MDDGHGEVSEGLAPASCGYSLAALIDGLAEPMMVIGPDYHITMMNRPARDFWASRAAGQPSAMCYEVSHGRASPCGGAEHPCPLEEVRESGQPVTVVHEHTLPNGEQRVVEIVASPLEGPSGEFEGIIESIRDVTARENASRELEAYAERLGALSVQMAKVAEVERKGLARELHDRVGQGLTALGINLTIVQAQLPADSPESLRTRLADSMVLVEESAAQIRDVMAELRPPVLDDYGLGPALRWYCARFGRRTGIPIDLVVDGPVDRLAVDTETALFRICQEALTNVAKHASASRVWVRLSAREHGLELTVEDDGVGIEASSHVRPKREGGWGILSMRERARAVDGRFTIARRKGGGTRLSVVVAA